MDYNFRALGPTAFEQLVQALVVGKYRHVEVIGRGPDGGRDVVINDFERPASASEPANVVSAVVQAKWIDVSDAEPAVGLRKFLSAASHEIANWRKVEQANSEVDRERQRREAEHAEADDASAERPDGPVEPLPQSRGQSGWQKSATDGRSPWEIPEDETEEENKRLRVLPTKRRTFDHLIFATNASLSGVAGKGGHDRFMAEIPPLLAGMRMSGVEVWSYAQLCSLVDDNKDVRDLYFAGLIPGDVREWLESREGENRRRTISELHAALLKDFRSDEFMEPGHLGELESHPSRLTDIFFDLPADSFNSAADLGPSAGQVRRRDPDDMEGLLDFLAARADGGDPRTSEATYRLTAELVSRLDSVGRPQIVGDARQRYVVVGGPGQGKTTASRFIGQLYRAAIASTASKHGVEDDVAQLSDQIMACASATNVPNPVLRRWPFRIVLSDYASRFQPKGDAATTWTGPPLLKFLQDRINSVAQVPIKRVDLQQFMADWPVLLILDGMDETPTASRPALVEAIRQFEDSARENNVDLATLITTRPQAVGTDFDQQRYRHLEVRPLNGQLAQSYGEQLLSLRFAHDPARRDSNVTRLVEAIKDSGTSGLFRTPLQVAILVILLESRERLPESRYKLFDAYFRTIYFREENKPTELAALLQRHREVVESVHKRLALYLHLRAENAMGASVRATTEEVETVLRALLARAGNVVTLESRLQELVNAIRLRFVFLVSGVENTWGFEVQSIQEYLVARALLDEDLSQDDDPDPSKTARKVLELTATSTRWRNVWLLTAGASFLHSDRARDRIMNILNALDYRDGITVIARPAASLAVDILDDRIAHQHPDNLKALLGLAMRSDAALPGEKAKTLVDSLVELQRDPEIAPMILTSLQGIARSGGSEWFALACRRLSDDGPLQAQIRELSKHSTSWSKRRRSSGGNVLETLAMIAIAASKVTELTADETAVLDEINVMTGQTKSIAYPYVSQEAAIGTLARRFTDRHFVDSFASLLSRAFSGTWAPPQVALQLINRIDSLADHASEIWPLVGHYTVLRPE